MNKKLLALAALAAMAIPSISAKTVTLAETDFSKVDSYNFWSQPEDNKPVIEDGALKVTNAEVLPQFYNLQYIVIDNVSVKANVEYTVTLNIKGFSGKMHYGLGNWSATKGAEKEVAEAADYQEVSVVITPEADASPDAHLILQSGDFVGTYYVQKVTITYDEEGGETPEQPEQPTTGVSLLNDNSYWMKENAGEPALTTAVDGVYTVNLPAEPGAEWDAQFFVKAKQAITTGQKYVFSFEAKSTSPRTVDIQAHAENPGSYVLWNIGAQDNKFDVTEDWKTYTFNGTVPESDGGQFTGSFDIIAMNLCKINEAGTISFKNIVWNLLEEGAGLDAVEVAPVVNHWTVYNLMGVKVLDTDNEAAVNELANGIYVINGKKVAIRK